jgi:zinc/manganese transport system permease protein
VIAADLAIVAPAFVAGLLVLVTHVPLGREVLRRGIVFIDLAVAQIAGLGVIVAGMLGWDDAGWGAQLAAAAAALLGAALLTWTERRWPEVQEAQIGVLFVLAATGGLLLLAHHPQGGEHLRDLLAGQILWVPWRQIAGMALLTAGLVAAWALLRGRPGRLAFYAMFAIAVTASVQVVGVYLVFATLIVPALGARAWPARYQLPLALGIGVAGYAVGLVASTQWDLPSGALVVWALALAAVLAHALAPPQSAPAQPSAKANTLPTPNTPSADA